MSGFTVAIPAKNEAELLPATLQGLGAIRDQRIAHVVVVDDGSTDAVAVPAGLCSPGTRPVTWSLRRQS